MYAYVNITEIYITDISLHIAGNNITLKLCQTQACRTLAKTGGVLCASVLVNCFVRVFQ
jgi:hypothetical protein